MDMKHLSGLPTQIRWPSVPSKSGTDKLHLAVLMGRPRKIRKLVSSANVPVDSRNSDGLTALFVAATLGKKDVVTTLLRLGANPNARCRPEGFTALHGACFIGSLYILRRLLIEGGDLRLSDLNRRRPEDWIEFQKCVFTRKTTRDFIERIRFCIMKKNLNEMKTELHDKVENLQVPVRSKIWTMMRRIGKMLDFGSGRSSKITKELRQSNPVSTGFGKVYFGTGTKCAEVIGIPCVTEALDLKLDSNPKAPSWICGKFSTFIPMFWNQRKTAVTSKVLRRKSVQEAVPDILISELALLVRLQHPQILMILAICQEENFDSLSLIFEKIALGSLYFFLHQQNLRMKSSFATDIIIQISEALDYIHGSGFLHCGISSHAVMLVGDNHAKLGCLEYAIPEEKNAAESFLSSRHPWLETDSHLSVLRHWLAPEVLIGTHPHSQASDVYSLCSVMWELVVGDVPWKDHDLAKLRILLKESPGLQLQLRKDVIPPLWLSVLQVGLKRKREERDLDFKEVRFMMTLAKERASCEGAGTSGSGERKSMSRVSLRSMIPNIVPPDGQGDRIRSRPILVETTNVDGDDDDQIDSIVRLGSNDMGDGSNTSICRSFKTEAFLQV